MNLCLTAVSLICAVTNSPARTNTLVEIHNSDVALFYRLYDTASGTPSGGILQREYIDAGTDGVRQFVPNRIISGPALATAIQQNRPVYEHARTCLGALPKVSRKLQFAFRKLARLDPEAKFPPVTILIGANNSGGTTGPSGVLIGLEVVCGATWLQPDPTDRLLHIIAHEYGHVQQPLELNDDNIPTTVLRQSLIEGVAELLGEQISGQVSNVHLKKWTRGRTAEIDAKFMADIDKTVLSDWLYKGVGTPERPGDLGYWVGYRIAKAYYNKARDKRAALRTLLELKDPKAVLAESGWEPGYPD